MKSHCYLGSREIQNRSFMNAAEYVPQCQVIEMKSQIDYADERRCCVCSINVWKCFALDNIHSLRPSFNLMITLHGVSFTDCTMAHAFRFHIILRKNTATSWISSLKPFAQCKQTKSRVNIRNPQIKFALSPLITHTNTNNWGNKTWSTLSMFELELWTACHQNLKSVACFVNKLLQTWCYTSMCSMLWRIWFLCHNFHGHHSLFLQIFLMWCFGIKTLSQSKLYRDACALFFDEKELMYLVKFNFRVIVDAFQLFCAWIFGISHIAMNNAHLQNLQAVKFTMTLCVCLNLKPIISIFGIRWTPSITEAWMNLKFALWNLVIFKEVCCDVKIQMVK